MERAGQLRGSQRVSKLTDNPDVLIPDRAFGEIIAASLSTIRRRDENPPAAWPAPYFVSGKWHRRSGDIAFYLEACRRDAEMRLREPPVTILAAPQTVARRKAKQQEYLKERAAGKLSK